MNLKSALVKVVDQTKKIVEKPVSVDTRPKDQRKSNTN